MPRQEKTRQVGVRIPKEYFATIQTVAEIKGQDNSTVLNELIFEAMPRIRTWLANQIGVRILAFKIVVGEMEPKPSENEINLMEALVRMLPKHNLPAELQKEQIDRLINELETNSEFAIAAKWRELLTQENAPDFLIKVLNKEDEIIEKIGSIGPQNLDDPIDDIDLESTEEARSGVEM